MTKSALMEIFDVDQIEDFICCKSRLYPEANPFTVERIVVRFPITWAVFPRVSSKTSGFFF